MQDGEVELGQRVALLGGAAEPGRRRLGIGLGALALDGHVAELELGGGIARLRERQQRCLGGGVVARLVGPGRLGASARLGADNTRRKHGEQHDRQGEARHMASCNHDAPSCPLRHRFTS